MTATRPRTLLVLACLAGTPVASHATPPSCSGVFGDVDNGSLFCPWIEQAYAEGIAGACAAGPLFCPDDAVSRQLLAMTVEKAAQTRWSLRGNAGTNPGTHFLGTTDNQALEIHVNGERALRIAPRTDTVSSYGSVPVLIGGWSGNLITAGPSPTSAVVGAVIAGGGYDGAENHAHDLFDFIGGGADNRAGSPDNDPFAGFNVVGGGSINVAEGKGAFVGGGFVNTASAQAAVVAGGQSNTASEVAATVVGGYTNLASGLGATVAGGYFNVASGDLSFAAGYRAHADGANSFVWADSVETDFTASNDNVFKVRATGGVKFVVGVDGTNSPSWTCSVEDGDAAWNCTSDRSLKENLVAADGQEILRRLATVPVYFWNAKGQVTPVPHLGPMAQDFHAAFQLGASDVLVNGMDLDGVALAAIQGLDRKLAETVASQNDELAALRARLAALESATARCGTAHSPRSKDER